jgi:methylglyoxal reductase
VRPLGKSGLSVSPVVLGCMAYGRVEDGERMRTIHAAFDAGVTSFDTAPLYGYGESEEVLGRALADRRGRVQILTKVGLRWDGDFGEVLFSVLEDGRPRTVRRDSRAASVTEEVEGSLRRLGVETIDLVQVHQPDRQTSFAETFGALDALVKAGKVRAIGVSNFSAAEVRGVAALASLQLEYNLLERSAERELLPLARQRGIGTLAYSPLAQGVLAGRQGAPADFRRDGPYFRRDVVATVDTALAAVVHPLARAKGVTAAAVCLAWVLSRTTAVIAGARDAAQATANARAADVALSGEEARALEGAFAPLVATGRLARAARALLRRLR